MHFLLAPYRETRHSIESAHAAAGCGSLSRRKAASRHEQQRHLCVTGLIGVTIRHVAGATVRYGQRQCFAHQRHSSARPTTNGVRPYPPSYDRPRREWGKLPKCSGTREDERDPTEKTGSTPASQGTAVVRPETVETSWSIPSRPRSSMRVRTLRSEGNSYRAICDTLHEEGLRPRRAPAWSPTVVRRIATGAPSAEEDCLLQEAGACSS